jgi:hypothetical protein
MFLEDFENWGASHETSVEIVMALHDFCKGDQDEMQRVWEAPLETVRYETTAYDWVISIAWGLADDATFELWWGETLIERPIDQ